MHSGLILKSPKTKTKAKVENPARQKLDVVPNYDNHQFCNSFPMNDPVINCYWKLTQENAQHPLCSLANSETCICFLDTLIKDSQQLVTNVQFLLCGGSSQSAMINM